jgi:predicted 3-demethylubiquinone-9 3-methyltransferase (glyoxalase superfamily)
VPLAFALAGRQGAAMKKVTTFLWFDDQAEAAAKFYISLFKRARISSVTRNGKKGPVTSATVTIDGQQLILFNGGPHYKLTPALSLSVDCPTQAEIDRLWKKLSMGGVPLRCGWVTDRYGLTWQIVPSVLGSLLRGKDRRKSAAATRAMLGMKKLDIAKLKQAYARG